MKIFDTKLLIALLIAGNAIIFYSLYGPKIRFVYNQLKPVKQVEESVQFGGKWVS